MASREAKKGHRFHYAACLKNLKITSDSCPNKLRFPRKKASASDVVWEMDIRLPSALKDLTI